MLAVIRISEITFESGVAGISGVTGNSGRWPPDLQGGLFYIFLHYPFKAHMRKKESMLQAAAFPTIPDNPEIPDTPDTKAFRYRSFPSKFSSPPKTKYSFFPPHCIE